MKVIVAHPGRQHSFRVATALKKSDMLYKYATTVYNKDDSLLMKVILLFLGKESIRRAKRRKCSFVPDEDVIQFCEFEGLFLLLLIRIDKSHRISNAFNVYVSHKFQKKLAKYIIKNNVDAVISYDTNSDVLFKILKEKAPNVYRIMDNAHANRHYLYYSYQKNIQCCGPFFHTLEACGYITNEKIAANFGEEVKLATHHIVASSYSEAALVFDGISKEKIYKVPYGVDENRFVEPKREYVDGKLNVLFIGEINQRKGIRQLLECAKLIDDANIEFNIAGFGANHHAELYAPYKKYVNFLGYLSLEELHLQLSENHIFVFPTMGEGFGLVLLEAMAAQIVPITTENCAGRDIIVDGVNGFIVPVGDEEAIAEKVRWSASHPLLIKLMGEKASETAKQYTWDRYNKSIVEAVKLICSA